MHMRTLSGWLRCMRRGNRHTWVFINLTQRLCAPVLLFYWWKIPQFLILQFQFSLSEFREIWESAPGVRELICRHASWTPIDNLCAVTLTARVARSKPISAWSGTVHPSGVVLVLSSTTELWFWALNLNVQQNSPSQPPHSFSLPPFLHWHWLLVLDLDYEVQNYPIWR